MAQEPLRNLLRGLRRLGDRSGGALTDAQLLERFARHRDEAAFEVLVWRYGPLVLGVCRRLLRHEQDVEDAFQAAFLVLVRKADTIARRESVGSWLYKVAYRVARAAQAAASKRATREQPWADQEAEQGSDEVLWRDLKPLLDEEVLRLPEKYRVPFVLCCLEGKTNEEAAAQLGCPRGTVLSRLARARARLRQRLTRRGVALSTGALALVSAERGLAAVPAGLTEMTIQAVLGGTAGGATAAGVSARAAALAEGVVRVMFLTRLKAALLVAAVLALVGVGGGFLGAGMLPGDPGAGPPGKVRPPQPGGVGPPGGGAPGKQDPMKEAQFRVESQNNLKQIGLALHNYNDTYKHLPPPAIYGKDGKALLSWRVAILPYLDQVKLYKQFKLNEPWDSPHNKKLLAKIPGIYAPVRGPSRVVGGTYYQAFVGKGAAFEPGKKLSIPGSFPDGISNTILVVEAGKPVPWTRPQDLPYVQDQALPALGGQFGGHFYALLGDGAVALISKNADEVTLRLAITRDDGLPFDFDKLHAPQVGKNRVDLDLLPQEILRLKDMLKKARADVAQARKEVAALKGKRKQPARPGLDPKRNELLRQHAELRDLLEHTVRELHALQAEAKRLRDELQKQDPDKD
jgi:RNA polymerase sigma factor (sigma-70 family)